MFSMSAISQERSFLSRRDVADDDRHAQQAGELGGAPAPFAGDDLESIADPPHDDRLDDAVGLDRLRRAPRAAPRRSCRARLEFIRREAVDVRLDSGGRPWWRQHRESAR